MKVKLNWDTDITNRVGDSVSVLCVLHYSKEFRETREQPGEPAALDLEEAWLGDFDILHILSKEQIERITELAWEEMQEAQDFRDAEYADQMRKDYLEERHALPDARTREYWERLEQ